MNSDSLLTSMNKHVELMCIAQLIANMGTFTPALLSVLELNSSLFAHKVWFIWGDVNGESKSDHTKKTNSSPPKNLGLVSIKTNSAKFYV